MKLLDTQSEFCDTSQYFESTTIMPEPVFNLSSGQNLMYHVILHSYTIQNIIAGTILDTKTDLGYFTDTTSIDISEWIEKLEAYTIPEGLPQWRLDMINNSKDLPGQFNLVIELVGFNGY